MSTTRDDNSAFSASSASAPPSYGSRVEESTSAYGAPARTGRNGFGTTALVLGIISIVVCFAWYVGIVLGILAIVFGVAGRKRFARGEATNGTAAKAGLITGIVGVVASIAVLIAVLVFVNSGTGKCLQNANGSQSAAKACVK